MFIATCLALANSLQVCAEVAGRCNALGVTPHLVVLEDGEVRAGDGAGADSQDDGSDEGEDLGEGEDGESVDGEGDHAGEDDEGDEDDAADAIGKYVPPYVPLEAIGSYGGTYLPLGFVDCHVLARVTQHGVAQAKPKWGFVYSAFGDDFYLKYLVPHFL